MNDLTRTIYNTGTIINFKPAFEMLNDELAKIGQFLEVVCVGGYVMQLHGFRGTMDIDAFYKSNTALDNAIRRVGDKLSINQPDEAWLNNSVANTNPAPSSAHIETVHQFSNLSVMKIDILYLMGMKLYSGRKQDLRDVATILVRDNNKQPLELLAKLENISFKLDISVVLDAYEEAYGMDWLKQFYIENEAMLEKLY